MFKREALYLAARTTGEEVIRKSPRVQQQWKARSTQRNFYGDRATLYTSGLSEGSDRVLAVLYRALLISYLLVILLIIIHSRLWSHIEEESDDKPSRNQGVPRILISQLWLDFLIPVSLQIIVLIKLISFLLVLHKLQFYRFFFFFYVLLIITQFLYTY